MLIRLFFRELLPGVVSLYFEERFVSDMSNRKGIILAGGVNSRLFPITYAVPKSLLPIYDKPMIYYPLSVLMLAGIRDILIITSPTGLFPHQQLLGDGGQWGINISYAEQKTPKGIADAFFIGESFVGDDDCALVLADNIFYGANLPAILQQANNSNSGATIFSYAVDDPQRFGIVTLNSSGDPIKLTEKPAEPDSNLAIIGCYFYDNSVLSQVMGLQPSARGELEITDLNQCYLEAQNLSVQHLDADILWFDAGTPDSLLTASKAVEQIQNNKQLLIAAPEEVAFNQGWIDTNALKKLADCMTNTEYGKRLLGAIA